MKLLLNLCLLFIAIACVLCIVCKKSKPKKRFAQTTTRSEPQVNDSDDRHSISSTQSVVVDIESTTSDETLDKTPKALSKHRSRQKGYKIVDYRLRVNEQGDEGGGDGADNQLRSSESESNSDSGDNSEINGERRAITHDDQSTDHGDRESDHGDHRVRSSENDQDQTLAESTDESTEETKPVMTKRSENDESVDQGERIDQGDHESDQRVYSSENDQDQTLAESTDESTEEEKPVMTKRSENDKNDEQGESIHQSDRESDHSVRISENDQDQTLAESTDESTEEEKPVMTKRGENEESDDQGERINQGDHESDQRVRRSENDQDQTLAESTNESTEEEKPVMTKTSKNDESDDQGESIDKGDSKLAIGYEDPDDVITGTVAIASDVSTESTISDINAKIKIRDQTATEEEPGDSTTENGHHDDQPLRSSHEHPDESDKKSVVENNTDSEPQPKESKVRVKHDHKSRSETTTTDKALKHSHGHHDHDHGDRILRSGVEDSDDESKSAITKIHDKIKSTIKSTKDWSAIKTKVKPVKEEDQGATFDESDHVLHSSESEATTDNETSIGSSVISFGSDIVDKAIEIKKRNFTLHAKPDPEVVNVTKDVDNDFEHLKSEMETKQGTLSNEERVADWLGGKKTNKKEQSFYNMYNKVVEKMYSKLFAYNEIQEKKEQSKASKAMDLIAESTHQKERHKRIKAIKQDVKHKIHQQTSNFWVSVPLFKNILGRTCFKDIGCFSASEYQDISARPIPLLPMSPEFMDPQFHIYTPNSKDIPNNFSYNAGEDILKASKFDPKLMTAVMVHGFRSGFEDWMIEMKDFIFNQSNEYNVICVVWEKGSKVPMYHLAAANTRVVGALIAFFIQSLCKTFDITHEKFHLIGHSLGGQVMGYAGKRLHKPKVARITGLDPAGPGFHFDNPFMRLHHSDASFVDAIHTDSAKKFSEGLGTTDTFGDIDFFPNGGLMQPGCRPSRGISNIISAIATGNELSCSHSRGFKFGRAIGNNLTECMPIGYECESYEVFSEGRCTQCENNHCQPMGIYLDYYSKLKMDQKFIGHKFYLNTAPEEEFCVYHYQIAIHISEDSDNANGFVEFNFKVIADGKEQTLNMEKIMSGLQIGEIHTLLITFEFKITKFISMSLKWKAFPDDLLPTPRKSKGDKIRIPFIEINFLSHIEESVRQGQSYIMCPVNGPETEIKPGDEWFELSPCSKTPETMTIRANYKAPEVLVAFSHWSDIYSNDFENQNPNIVKTKALDIVAQKSEEGGLKGFFG